MAFAEDLLEQAYHLARMGRTKPRQASLRRAVSTAYYALFNILIHDGAGNWKGRAQRARLARAFEHGKMRRASDVVVHSRFPGQDKQAASDLKKVASAFATLQEARHIADYDGSRKWSRTDALGMVDQADAALATWRTIRDEPIAQDYLLSLLTGRT
jgi:hypothetical protein